MKRFLPFVVPFTIAVLVTTRPAETIGPANDGGDKAIVHVLNRIAFGPRPGDVERVRAMGIDRYLPRTERPIQPEVVILRQNDEAAAQAAKSAGLELPLSH